MHWHQRRAMWTLLQLQRRPYCNRHQSQSHFWEKVHNPIPWRLMHDQVCKPGLQPAGHAGSSTPLQLHMARLCRLMGRQRACRDHTGAGACSHWANKQHATQVSSSRTLNSGPAYPKRPCHGHAVHRLPPQPLCPLGGRLASQPAATVPTEEPAAVWGACTVASRGTCKALHRATEWAMASDDRMLWEPG